MAAIRHPKDFWSGVIFVALGLFAIVYGSKYTLGTAARMGPGYFPRILGILLIVLGAILAVRALRLDGPPLPKWKWRPTVIVLGSVVLFGAIVQPVGVALSTVILIVGASAASPEFRPREALIAGILLAALAVGVFVIGLKLQLPIWPAFVS
jgi:Tripartite tricarboxylate transporter TctB family